jgi:transcriptional regulator with XRE-family HTH domain
MAIGNRIRELREAKGLSQEEIEQRTGLLRCYISLVENGRTIPSLENLERLAAALEIPLYQLPYDGDESPSSVGIRQFLAKLARLFSNWWSSKR